jgi:hypothetical protein
LLVSTDLPVDTQMLCLLIYIEIAL